jgi:hypothetical protein
MKSNKFTKYICLCAASMLMTACSNDANEPNSPEMGDFEGMMLSIPAEITTATRSETTDKEATINTLTVFAFPASDGEKVVKTFDASAISALNVNPANKQYKQLPVYLKKGSYHVYVVANLDIKSTSLSTQPSWSKVTESDLQGASITGMTVIDQSEISSKYLPMSCNTADIKTTPSDDSKIGTGAITINAKQTTQVYADLTIAVAKVRLTILNDANSALKVHEGNDNKFDGIKLQNSVNTEGVMLPVNGVTASSEYTLSGAYYNVPTNYSSGSMKTEGYAEDLNLNSLPTFSNEGKWAWQGVWYVPERIFASSITEKDKTKIDIKFNDEGAAYNTSRVVESEKTITLRDATTSSSQIGVHRGVFYDIIGYTTSKDLVLEVMVKPWQYHKYTYDLEPVNN